jgi:hypothetical protein
MLNNQNSDNKSEQSLLISEQVNDANATSMLGNELFLSNGSPLPNTECNEVENPLSESYGDMKANEVIQDIKTLSKTELKDKYPLSYSRWKNMKSRKNQGAVIDPRFHVFSDFLGYMGAVPSNAYTLDRIDNDDPTYSPDHCRWADKYTQNSNKGNNIYVTHEGQTHTIAQWAVMTHQKPNTLYKRKREGWADDEIVTGMREKLEIDPWARTPWPKGHEIPWEKSYQNSECYEGSKSRLEHLMKISKQYFTDIDRKYQILIREEGCVPENLKIDLVYWTTLFEKSTLAHRLRVRRKTFMSRYGKKDPAEAILFDLVNPTAVSFEELSSISKSEIAKNIRNQEESSE